MLLVLRCPISDKSLCVASMMMCDAVKKKRSVIAGRMLQPLNVAMCVVL